MDFFKNKKLDKKGGSVDEKVNVTKEDLFRKILEQQSQKSPSEHFASGAVFDISQITRASFLKTAQSKDAIQMLKLFTDAYFLFLNKPEIVKFTSAMIDKEKNDTDPKTWNVDIVELQKGEYAVLLFMPIQNEMYSARIVGIVFSDNGDGYYYCMLNKNETTFSEVFRNKAFDGIEQIGVVKGSGFDLMNCFLECMKKNFYHFDAQTEESEISLQIKALEEAVKKFDQSKEFNTEEFLKIVDCLISIPLYFPVDVDPVSILGNIDPMSLKKGDTIQVNNDTKMKVITLSVDNEITFVPAFTTAEKARECEAGSVVRMYPADYIPILIDMNLPAILNPLSKFKFYIPQDFIRESLMPRVSDETEQKEDSGQIMAGNISSNLGRQIFIAPLKEGTLLLERFQIVSIQDVLFDMILYRAIDLKRGKMVLLQECALCYEVGYLRENGDTQISVRDDKQSEFEKEKRSFFNQAQVINEIENHKNLHKFYCHFTENGTAYRVIDLLEGESLSDYLKKAGDSRRLPVKESLQITIQILQGLQAVHKSKFLHMDVRPHQIYIDNNGQVKLFIDAGLLCFQGSKREAIKKNMEAYWKRGEHGAVVMQAEYLPPEAYMSKNKRGIFTDIYSVGAVLYRMVTGKRPIESTDRLIDLPKGKWRDDLPAPKELNAEISDGLNAIILKAMSIEPRRRYQTDMEMIKALKNELENIQFENIAKIVKESDEWR